MAERNKYFEAVDLAKEKPINLATADKELPITAYVNGIGFIPCKYNFNTQVWKSKYGGTLKEVKPTHWLKPVTENAIVELVIKKLDEEKPTPKIIP
jgi:hypothetical protein